MLSRDLDMEMPPQKCAERSRKMIAKNSMTVLVL